MAKLEIPSIVVQTNCIKTINMKKQGPLRAQRTLSKQAEFDEEEPIVNMNINNINSSSSDSVTMTTIATQQTATSTAASAASASPKQHESTQQSDQRISTVVTTDGGTEHAATTHTNTTSNNNNINHTSEIAKSLVNSCHGAMNNSTTAGVQRTRTSNKVKLLVRSQAIRETASPPREAQEACSPLSSPPAMVHSTTITDLPLGSINSNNIISSSPPLDNNTLKESSSQLYNVIPSTSPTTMQHYDSSPPPAHHQYQPVTYDSCIGGATTVADINLETINNSSNTIHVVRCGGGSGGVGGGSDGQNTSPSNNTSTINSNHNINNRQLSNIKITTSTNLQQQQHQPSIVCQNCSEPDCANCLGRVKHLERTINNNNNNIAGNNNNNNNSNNNLNNSNTLTVSRANSKNKLKHQTSSSFDSALEVSPCLSRDSSTEYTDTTGVNLSKFILETLNRNAKDRMLMLKIEQELVNLAKDKSKSHFKFPPMSSYQRMLVHRCAAYFGMDHNIEQSGKCVIVNKTKNTRVPDIKFRDQIRDDLLFPEEPRRSILKRDSNSFEECFNKSPDRQMLSLENRRSKSFEEREEEYEKVRRRIFNREQMHDCNSQEELGWAEIPWSSSDSDNSSRMRLLPPDHQNYRPTRLLKGHSVETRDTLRPCVSKSFSFGGYTGSVSLLSRGDSVTSTHSAGARLLSKQDSATSSSMSWRLSPSSSGYKSQSQRSDSVTPSPTATPYPTSGGQGTPGEDSTQPPSVSMSWEEPVSPPSQSVQPGDQTMSSSQGSQQSQDYGNNTSNNHSQHVVWTSYHQSTNQQRRPPMIWTSTMSYEQSDDSTSERQNAKPIETAAASQPPIMWAITDLNKVPKGSRIINSETGAPFKNPDGTDYIFDPNNLHPALVLMVQNSQASLPQTNSNTTNTQLPQQSAQCSPDQTQQSQLYNNTNNGNAQKQQSIPANQKQNYNTSNSSKPPNIQRQNSKQSSSLPYNNNQPQNVKTYTPSNNKSTTPPMSGGPKQSQVPQSNGKITPSNVSHKSPVKQNLSTNVKTESATTQSPKKSTKYQQKSNTSVTSSNKSTKTGFTNTATSPSLPFTPPMQPTVHYNQNSQPANYQYLPNSQYDNVNNLPIPPFPTINYHNNTPAGVFGSSTMVPIHNSGTMQMYGEESPMVYSYGVPQYTRMDSSVSELSGYFVNMNLNSDVPGSSANTTQPITYQSAAPYWGHQPMVCYVPPQNSQATQRYSVPLVQGQSGGYISTYPPPQPSGPTSYPPTITPGNTHTAPQSNTELVPLYPAGPPPPSIVYGHPPTAVVPNGANVPLTNHPPPPPQSIVYATTNPPPHNTIMYTPNAPHQMYATTPNLVYSNSGSSHHSNAVYPTGTNTPNSSYSNNSNFTPQSSVYNVSTNEKGRQQKHNTSGNGNASAKTRNATHSAGGGGGGNPPLSNQSSTSSNSPASTVVQTYYHHSQPTTGNGMTFNTNRHCSPSETPPNVHPSNMSYGYHQFQPMPPPHILPPQSTMLYRNNMQMGVRVSPPVNSRTSRSPTPSAEHYDRNNRFSMMQPVYQSVPCIVPGDMRFMSPRQQTPPSYRNAYNRPSTFPQAISDTNLGRPPKVKKTRTKPTPPLPPSGR